MLVVLYYFLLKAGDMMKNVAANSARITPHTNSTVIECGGPACTAASAQVFDHGKLTSAYLATSANRPTTCVHKLSFDTNLPVMPEGLASISTMS